MRKYVAVANVMILDALSYWGELIIWQIIEFLPFVMMMLLWLGRNSQVIHTYTPNQLVTYYLIGLIVSRFMGYYFADRLTKDIRMGEFSKYLLRPWSFIWTIFFAYSMQKVVRLAVVILPMILLIVLFFLSHVQLPTSQNLISLLGLLLIGNCINFLIQMIFVATAFFLKTIEGLKHAQWMAISILGGQMLPLDILPEWLQKVAQWLPFHLLYYTPISLYLGKLTPAQGWQFVGEASGWLLILLLCYRWLWIAGVKRYSAVGG